MRSDFFEDFDKYYIGIQTVDEKNTVFVVGISINDLIMSYVPKIIICTSFVKTIMTNGVILHV